MALPGDPRGCPVPDPLVTLQSSAPPPADAPPGPAAPCPSQMDTARFQSSVIWDIWKKDQKSALKFPSRELGFISSFFFFFFPPRLGGTGAGWLQRQHRQLEESFFPPCLCLQGSLCALMVELRHYSSVLKSFRCLF